MAGNPTARPTFHPDGVVDVPAFRLPPSEFASPEARIAQERRASIPIIDTTPNAPIDVIRRQLDEALAPKVAQMRALYPTDMVESAIAGVPVRIITPANGEPDPDRILLNLHGGAFSVCWDACSMIESVPIASVGRFTVISVDYPMAPEARHPAAVDHAARVYAELLKTYAPTQVGVFGCSAGGALTAQLAAWCPAHGLPQPGAIGIFGAGGVRFMGGDSAYVTGYIDGSFPPPAEDGAPIDITRGYFDGSDMSDASVSPALHLDVLAQFPPTLLITGTRAMDLSPAVFTNSQLIKAGADTALIVGEALGHCYLYSPELPESRDAYDAVVAHFRRKLHA